MDTIRNIRYSNVFVIFSAIRNTNTRGPCKARGGPSDLGEKLEQAVHMALNEVVAILGFSLNPDDRAFASILKAKTTILSSVLNAQVRVDERRFVKEDTEHDRAVEALFEERMRKAQLEIDRMSAPGARGYILQKHE
jgi:hypothetical protein